MDRHLEKAMERLEAAVKALEAGGASGGADNAALRGEIDEIRAMIGEAVELLDGSTGGGGA